MASPFDSQQTHVKTNHYFLLPLHNTQPDCSVLPTSCQQTTQRKIPHRNENNCGQSTLWQLNCIFLAEFYLFFLSASLTENSRSVLSVKSNFWMQCQHPAEVDWAARTGSQAAAISWGWRQRDTSVISLYETRSCSSSATFGCLESKDREKEPPGVKHLPSYSSQSKKKMLIRSNIPASKHSNIWSDRMKSKLPGEDQMALNGLVPHDQYGLKLTGSLRTP